MQIKHYDGQEEKQILIGMIVDTTTLAKVDSQYEDKMFESKWSNIVAGWCIKHYRKYKKAPGKAIQRIFTTWASDCDDRKLIELVELFMETLSDEYDSKEFNSNYLIDRAAVYFNKVKIKRLLDNSLQLLDNGDLEKAQTKIETFRRVQMGDEEYDYPLNDIEVHKKVFEEHDKSLIEYPGELGRFFGNRLCRGGFICFQAPEKGKKSWWLMDIAWRGIMARRKVLVFVVGDMNQEQYLSRLQTRMLNRPHKPGSYDYPFRFKRVKIDGVPNAKARYKTKIHKHQLDLVDVKTAQEKIMKSHIRSKKKFLITKCLPTLSISEIRSRLDRLRDYDNWVPDIIVLDYADLLDGPPGVTEKRDQINDNWRQLRVINLEIDCLLATATQASARAFNKMSQDRTHFSDNKLKMAHVTGLVGLNESQMHDGEQISMLNWIVVRDGNPYRPVWTVGCLEQGNPAVLSC